LPCGLRFGEIFLRPTQPRPGKRADLKMPDAKEDFGQGKFFTAECDLWKPDAKKDFGQGKFSARSGML
jgi:hypothetical protein